MTLTQTRIRNVSRIFCLIFQVLFVIVPLLHIVAWFNTSQPPNASGIGFFINAIPKGTLIMSPLDFHTRVYGFLLDSVPMVLIESIIYFLIRLFKLYQRGEIFSLQNVKYIKYIGYALLALQIVRPILDGLLSALLTWGNPPGHRYATVSISGTDVSLILTAFIIILISWIMAEGCRLREEQQLTI